MIRLIVTVIHKVTCRLAARDVDSLAVSIGSVAESVITPVGEEDPLAVLPDCRIVVTLPWNGFLSDRIDNGIFRCNRNFRFRIGCRFRFGSVRIVLPAGNHHRGNNAAERRRKKHFTSHICNKFVRCLPKKLQLLAKSFGILEHRCSFYKNQLGTGMPYRSLSPDWKHNPIRQRKVCENILNMQGFSRLASAVKNRPELVCVCSLYKLKEIYIS